MGVIDLAQRRLERSRHLEGPCRCLSCKHEWRAVAPVGTIGLECPACGLNKGAFLNLAYESGKEHWLCNCGNDLFFVSEQGPYCGVCGTQHTPESMS